MVTGPKLLVLGLGNILSGDDGIGIRIINHFIDSERQFPDVEFMDAGTAGLKLLNMMDQTPAILAIDAAEMGLEPGASKLITPDQFGNVNDVEFSLHDLGFAETLYYAEKFFSRPATVIFAIQPDEIGQGEWLSPALEKNLQHYLDSINQILKNWEKNCWRFGEIILQAQGMEGDDLLHECLA
jgi:hydrogenase maturation protease